MFPDEPWRAAAEARGAAAVAAPASTGVRDGRSVGVGRSVVQQRSTLYDSFELNAMVARLNRLLLHGGDGARRPAAPRSPAGGWLAVPKVLIGKIKRAFLGGPRRGGS